MVGDETLSSTYAMLSAPYSLCSQVLPSVPFFSCKEAATPLARKKKKMGTTPAKAQTPCVSFPIPLKKP